MHHYLFLSHVGQAIIHSHSVSFGGGC